MPITGRSDLFDCFDRKDWLIHFATRRKYIPVGSSAASMQQTVAKRTSQSLLEENVLWIGPRRLNYPKKLNSEKSF
jgi:hypothetical protein